jgi:hypothetical protein
MSAPLKTEQVVWQPQEGPQYALFCCNSVPEVFFGGSRGGGKTDGMLGKWAAKAEDYGPDFNGVMLRRTTVSSTDAIDRSKRIFGQLGGKFNETKLQWRMPGGGKVSFGYLDSIYDADEYQGRNVTDFWIEEAGQFPDPAPILRLFGALRSGTGVPVQIILTANPGGPGQNWIRERYELVPFPESPKLLTRELPNGKHHSVAVIPSRLTDNKLLLAADPGYADRLQLVGKPALVRAWLNGDWNAIEGAFFEEWDETKHVIKPFDIPEQWLKFRSMDWGSASPFSVGWWAIASDDYQHGKVTIPRGAMVRYREWYGSQPGDLGTGLKMRAEDVGKGIYDREKLGGETISYGVIDPSAFAEDGGPSIVEMMRKGVKSRSGDWIGPRFRKADNTRVGKLGFHTGWMAVRARLEGENGLPMLYSFDTCKALIRTLPLLQHDPDRPEDLNTHQVDHAADETRYACLSRPYVRKVTSTKPDKDWSGYSSFRTTAKPARVSVNTL